MTAATSPALEQPAIQCESIWQVFGTNAEDSLREALANHGATTSDVASTLKDKGLIPAVRDATFTVGRSELFVIMGLSGSGKSTIVRCISRLVEPTGGAVKIEGEDILSASPKRLIELRRNKLGMVFQHFGLFPHMTVTDNVAFPLKMQGQDAKSRLGRAMEVIELVGLKGRENSYPRELSGGQRQRVGIARSLAADPDIWFLDEPFSALDPLIRRQLQDEFLDIQANLHKSIVFITHDIAEALKLADRIAIMRDGNIVQIGTPTDIVLRPVSDYVRDFARDVAKGRHATVNSVMKLIEGPPEEFADDPKLRPGMTLDHALASCMSLYHPVPVWDGDGKIIGSVDPADLAAALQVD